MVSIEALSRKNDTSTNCVNLGVDLSMHWQSSIENFNLENGKLR